MNWNDVEKEPGQFDWRRVDEQVDRAERLGYAYQHLISYGNEWAVREGYVEKYQPREGWWINTVAPKPDPWRNYVRAIGERYKGRVQFWEIWNEPDLSGFFKGTTDDYLELLRIASTELRAIDPDAEIWTGGFATVNPHGGHNLNPDLQRRVIAEGQEFFDVIAHHEHGTFRGFQRALDVAGRPPEGEGGLQVELPLLHHPVEQFLIHARLDQRLADLLQAALGRRHGAQQITHPLHRLIGQGDVLRLVRVLVVDQLGALRVRLAFPAVADPVDHQPPLLGQEAGQLLDALDRVLDRAGMAGIEVEGKAPADDLLAVAACHPIYIGDADGSSQQAVVVKLTLPELFGLPDKEEEAAA
jgi:hypothetical protein